MDGGILFSTFEHSGDQLAARVIERIGGERPDTPIYALGGDAMRDAGAQVVEHTPHLGSMFLDTVKQVFEHRRRLKRLEQWLSQHRIGALVPVDSPAGNWSICELVRRMQPRARIIHLVAPQLWAWGPWRIKKMRRLTDGVLCLLPFEPAWFAKRGVTGAFVGHPMLDPAAPPPPFKLDDLPDAHPRLAMLPGSRRSEIKRNTPVMLRAFEQLCARHTGLHAVIPAANEHVAKAICDLANRLSREALPRLILIKQRADDALRWCDVALAASGSVTLQAARHGAPTIAMYRMPVLAALIAAAVKCTDVFTLPNIVAGHAGLGRAIPEFIPNFVRTRPITRATDRLLSDEAARTAQRRELARVVEQFAGVSFTDAAPRELLNRIERPDAAAL